MDGPPPPEEDFSALSIEDRLAHKNWKARVSAYETLIKTFQTTASDNDPAFRPYLSHPDLLKKMVTDSNAVAQEKGVECAEAFVKFAGENAARTREAVVPALVDKCLGSTRAGTRNHAIELVLQYVEVENSGAGVITDVASGLGAKQPKVVAGCVTAMKEVVRLFGIQVTPPPPVIKALPKIFGHTDKTVRAEGTQLTHALYQYIGPTMESFLGDLKPVQVKELKEAWEGMEKEGHGKGSLKPERLTRQAARDAEAAQLAGGDDAGDGDAAADAEPDLPDPRSFAEEVDIVAKMPANFYGNMASSKWKERKEALDDLLTMLQASIRIKDAPEHGELAKTLATCIHKDANVACVTTAASCMEALAKGASKSFGRYRESIVTPMMERLKERKASVTDVIGLALDAVFTTTSLPDIIGDIQPMLSNKNPQIKEGSLKFLSRCLSNGTTPIQQAQIKPVSETLATLLEDSVAGCREEAATCLGTLMKMVGERPLNALMSALPAMRQEKVKEAFKNATVKCKGGEPAPKPPAPAAKAPPAKKPVPTKKPPPPPVEDDLDQPGPPAKKPPAKLAAKKPPGAAAGPSSAAAPTAKKLPPAAAPKASGKAAAAPAAGSLDTFKYKHGPEDAEALWTELIPPNFQADLGDSNWKTRLAALEEMTGWVDGAVDDLDSEVVVRFLAKKGWGEKNFQVSAKIYGILAILAERCPTFGRSSAALCIPHLSEKLGDAKLKKPAGDTMIAFAERTSLQFVLGHAYEPLGKQKAPKVVADALAWVDNALTEFGIAGLALRSLIDFLKTALANSNAAVRTNATKTLVTVKLFAGASIKELLGELNPQLLNTINSEFDKVEGNEAPEPTRFSAEVVASTTESSGGKGAASAAADPLDDLFPRVELDGLLKGTSILTDGKSDAWKTKKEALEALQAILDQGANKRLKANMGEIGQILKARVADTNKAVQMLALDIVARVATGMGKPFEKHCRLFDNPVATVLSDQKAPIRAAALQTLTAMATACESVDPMVKGLTTALETQNPVQKASLLTWLVDWFTANEPTPALDLSGWVNPVVACLDDRNADVRKGAQALLPTLITCAGYDAVIKGTNGLKPASRSSATALIKSAHASAQPRAPPPAAAKPASSAKVREPEPEPEPEDSPPQSPVPAPAKGAAPRRKLLMGAIPKAGDSRPGTPAEEAPKSRLPGKPGVGLRRPGTAASKPPPAAASPVPSSAPFFTSKLDAKKARLSKDAGKWVNEGGATRKDLFELLQHQMEPHASRELLALLFSHDHDAVNDHVKGLSMISAFYSGVQAGDDAGLGDDATAVCLANCDLALKYVSIKVHEPQSNVVGKCMETVEAVLSFLKSIDYQLTDAEASCFVPTMVYKLGDAREPVRVRVQAIIQTVPSVYAYSHAFQLLLEHGLKSKVAKARQGTLDELAGILKRFGMNACDPKKALPQIGATIADKDPAVRKAALGVLSEAYTLVGEKIWSLVGPLSSSAKGQLEERLRRVAGPSSPPRAASPESRMAAPTSHASRLQTGIPRSGSPAPGQLKSRIGGIPRPSSPSMSSHTVRAASPAPTGIGRPASPLRPARSSNLPAASSPSSRPKSLMPSKLGSLKARPIYSGGAGASEHSTGMRAPGQIPRTNGIGRPRAESKASVQQEDIATVDHSVPENVTIIISSILSSDPSRSVDALKKIQKILEMGPDNGPSSPAYRELAEHTEGLIETITLQMAHVFGRPEEIILPENFRLAKHLIQTLNAFCDHVFLAESLTVDILTSLLEELTLRLLETDDSPDSKVKDLSRFINMIILRLFATARRMSVFRSLFALLLQIVKPFPANGTPAESKEAKIAELVLKCIWKLARNMPQDLEKQILDPVELFPAIEHLLQSVPPNEWRARATNKVPCGDMPLRTIKVIIQHVVAHYGDEVYDLLSGAFDDPSATIVYPYVYRILNSSTRVGADIVPPTNGSARGSVHESALSRPTSPPETASSVTSGDHDQRQSSPSRQTSRTASSGQANGNGTYSPPVQEPDPDDQLLKIIQHISSETTGALHKEGITELHQFMKAHPHKKPKVDKMLEATGPAFRKYITRALASRAAEDQERNVAVAQTLSQLEANSPVSETGPASPLPAPARTEPRSPRSPRTSGDVPANTQERLTRLHDLFQYRSSTASAGSSNGR